MKHIVILGATSSMAEAYSLKKAEASEAQVFHLFARNKEKLSLVANNLKLKRDVIVHEYVYDLDDISKHQEIVNYFKSIKIDILFLAYGVLGSQNDSEKNIQKGLEIIHSNFVSAVSLLSLFANEFEKNKSGTIAVISSVAGDRGRQSNYFYGSSKAALTTFLSGLRNRLFQHNVNVLTIKPGFVDTPMTKDIKKGILFVGPNVIANDIDKAITKRKEIIYTPFFWRYIMLIIIHIPEKVFKKLKL